MLEKPQLDHLISLLRQTSPGHRLILVGSAAMYLTPTSIPPMTADADVAVPREALEGQAAAFLDEMRRLGFQQVADTATFVHPIGGSLDLLGLDAPGSGDRVLRVGGLALLAFEDLCRLAAHEGAVREAAGIRVLAPAALVLSKLLTWRVDKGVRDKIQALAMLGDLEADRRFLQDLQALIAELPPDAWEDAVADAQAAFRGLETEEARDYLPWAGLVERGWERLVGMRPAA